MLAEAERLAASSQTDDAAVALEVDALRTKAATLMKEHSVIITWELRFLLCEARETYFSKASSCQLEGVVSAARSYLIRLY